MTDASGQDDGTRSTDSPSSSRRGFAIPRSRRRSRAGRRTWAWSPPTARSFLRTPAEASPARHDQRSRLAAAPISWRGTGATSRHRRRAPDRGHHHADGRRTRRRRHVRESDAPDRPRRDQRRRRTRPGRARRRRCCSTSSTISSQAPPSRNRRMTRSSTYASKVTKDEGLIDWTLSASRHPQPRPRPVSVAARLHVSGRRATHPDAHACRVRRPATSRRARSSTPPVVFSTWPRGNAGQLAIEELQPEGRRAMKVRDYLAGHPVQPGTRFGSR